jgi:homoserine dehydrogenase
VSPPRVWLIGFGTVGRWLADALDTQAERLAARFGCAVRIVGIANTRDGFAYDAGANWPRSPAAGRAVPRRVHGHVGDARAVHGRITRG